METSNYDGSIQPRPEIIYKKGDLLFEELINTERLCVTSPVGLENQSMFNTWLTDLFIPETLTDTSQHQNLLIDGNFVRPSLEFFYGLADKTRFMFLSCRHALAEMYYY